MRTITSTLALVTTALLTLSSAHAATTPTIEQIQSAVDAGVAKSASPVPMAFRITSLVGCRPSPEVKEETVCLVGMSAGMRDGFTVLPLRQDGATWVGVERKNAEFPGPTTDEVKAAMTALAAEKVAADPAAANDPQVKALPGMVVKSVDQCKVERKTGNLLCAAKVTVPGQGDVKADMRFVLGSQGWRMAPR